MTLCDRFFRAAVKFVADSFDLASPFWQTPREVEWAKAAADGGERCECGHRIHDSNVCPVGECLCLGWFPDRDLSPAPEFDWVTTAIPVIAGVLAEHMPDEAINGVDCIGHGETRLQHQPG